MSFDKFKSFWRTSSQILEESILDKTQNFITGSFRRTQIPVLNTSEFQDYLATLPSLKRVSRKHKNSNSSLKPELFKRCLQIVDKQYFSEKYEIDYKMFDRKALSNSEKQIHMQQQLDEVQVCLFNQITNRFDEILSVLRTIQSLDLVVIQSQRKLKQIRNQNFKKVIKVTEKQNKLARLIRRKKNLEAVTLLQSKLKQYKNFKQLEHSFESPETIQIFYATLPNLRNNSDFYKKIRATKNINMKIEEAETAIKLSFSDKLNDKILQYLKRDIPYGIQFWKRAVNSRNILEDAGQQSKDRSALLDESTIMADQDLVSINPRKQENLQGSIMEFLRKGWQDGEYSVGKLKAQIDSVLKNKHNSFLLDFRNFADEICRIHNLEVENPSLTNLLKWVSISFCIKAFNYFFDIHKSVILRYFSLSRRVGEFIQSFNDNVLTIDQKQKLKILMEGFVNTGSFLVRLVVEKLVDIIDTKALHEGVDIGQIKQLAIVFENSQLFLQKQVEQITTIPRIGETFLAGYIKQIPNRYPIKLLENAKKKKLLDYLNKLHKNALTVQLKQSLENQIWQPTDIPTFYYDSLHYLITGQSLNLRRNKHNLKGQSQNSMMFQTSVLVDNRQQSFFQQPSKLMGNFRIIRNDIIINGLTYKVTQTLLLLLQILEDYMTLAQNFQILKTEIGIRINEVIRSYNMSSCQLIVHAGAVALQKIKTKNITSRHLALSSLSLSFLIYVMDCMQKRIQILDYPKLKQTIEQHIQIIIKKLNQILVYKANSSKNEINLKSTPSKGTESIVSNTKILLQILSDYYTKQTLSKIFTKEVLNIYVEAISNIRIANRVEAESLKDDVAFFFEQLKALQNFDNNFAQRRVFAEDIVRRGFEEL